MPASLGIFGGTFDPPHLGHVALATAAWRQLGLEQIRVIPAASAPLRLTGPSATPAQRVAMCRCAFVGLPWAVVDEREVKRAGVSWSIETARELAAEYPASRRVWILGADQLERLPQWREVEELVQLVEFAVLAREGNKVEVPVELRGLMRLTVLQAPAVPVAATAIRAALQRGDFTQNGLPSEVARYIDEHQLYRS